METRFSELRAKYTDEYKEKKRDGRLLCVPVNPDPSPTSANSAFAPNSPTLAPRHSTSLSGRGFNPEDDPT
jgi:hypothetical protein